MIQLFYNNYFFQMSFEEKAFKWAEIDILCDGKFLENLGCLEQCPFCGVVCNNLVPCKSNSKRQNNTTELHEAPIHRPLVIFCLERRIAHYCLKISSLHSVLLYCNSPYLSCLTQDLAISLSFVL